MDNVGAEVGQKMRSAVKAKLMELGCYVDDELPDYIMVMVANKRTKSQMNHDLELFLKTKTSAFVDWLHIVLKKLEEITVTNPALLKKISKRKSGEDLKFVKVKKEKRDKVKVSKKMKKKDLELPVSNIKVESSIKVDSSSIQSLTDGLPVKSNKFAEVRKIVIMKESNGSNNVSNEENVIEDSFDIPPLSEVSNESELTEIEKKIKNVKSRLGIQIASGSEDEDYINLKADPDDLFSADSSIKEKKFKEELLRKISVLDASNCEEQLNTPSRSHTSEDNNERSDRPGMVFGNENVGSPTKRKPVLERLGKRLDTSTSDSSNIDLKRKRVHLSELRREEEEILGISKTAQTDINDVQGDIIKEKEIPRESALKRLGLMSKVAIPQKEVAGNNSEEDAEDLYVKDVPSAVKVKPRTLLPSSKQANKNLLLKAVAEAQRSVAQTPVVGNNKLDAIYTKKYKERLNRIQSPTKKLSVKDKNNLRKMLVTAVKQDKKELDFSSDDDNLEYIPKPVKHTSKSNNQHEYIPSSRGHSSDDCENLISEKWNKTENCDNTFPKQTKNQTFIITLDGISRKQDIKNIEIQKSMENNENKKRKAPSPIIFESSQSMPVTLRGKAIPESLSPVTHAGLKAKERCKYWPACRQGDKCEFVHPNTSCRTFPQCKFGDKCLYIHPTCKFEASCTRKECPFNHVVKTTFSSTKSPQMCKFYPNCSNIHCSFFHPKPCKYGKNCKNLKQCTFSHTFPSKGSLTWRSSIK